MSLVKKWIRTAVFDLLSSVACPQSPPRYGKVAAERSKGEQHDAYPTLETVISY